MTFRAAAASSSGLKGFIIHPLAPLAFARWMSCGWPSVVSMILMSLAIVLIALFGAPERAGADGGVIIVCNASNPITSLTGAELKNALTGGTKQWSNGAIVQVGLTATDSREVVGLATAADMTAPELLSRIQQQVFKGEMRKPIMLRSSAECIGLAHALPGGICAATPGGALPPDVKIIQVR
jgi:hypothetical protein